MKLDGVKPFYESSGAMDEQFFSVEDQGMIFDILRNKMYSNPILAICREIACNARDAHREVGKPDEPIHIQLPGGLQPEYRIKDFGPGISPDRMLNVFIKYTASTKRNDNKQTGGFGLGAKTPFSYSDQFHILTVVDGTKYSYTCGIDETKIGKLVLLGKESCEEPNSTEIAVPVKPADFHPFRQYTEQSCRHWTVKPIISGGSITWTVHNKIMEGDKWAITNDSGSYYGGSNPPKLVIDGIEYPLDMIALRKYADTKLIDATKGTLVMYFDVGELSLSANREQVYLDKPTQDKIRERLQIIQQDIKKRVEDKIQSFPSYWEANIYYRKELTDIFQSLDFLAPLDWRGYKLINKQGSLHIGCNVYYFERGRYSRKYGDQPDKLSRSLSQTLTFDVGYELYLNDLTIKDPTIRHVKKAFDDNPALKRLQVICPNVVVTEANLIATINLDQMAPKKLSSITKATGRTYTPSASRLLVFKFDITSSSFRQSTYDTMDEDTNTKVLCLLSRRDNERVPLLANKASVATTALFQALLAKESDTSFYGIDKDTDKDRIAEEFADCIRLDTFVYDKVLNNKSINYMAIKFAQEKDNYESHYMIDVADHLEPLLLNKQSIFLSRLTLLKKMASLKNTYKELLFIYEQVNGEITESALDDFVRANPEWDITKLNEEYEKRYKLLMAVPCHRLLSYLGAIADYINLIDKDFTGVSNNG